ncbi:MAG: acyl-CoA dehydrogenase family protein, partial [Acidobacteriota bacterium]|nr:acyl-CoA dehydrogenase family protein [Acidobacteriota bacterium]
MFRDTVRQFAQEEIAPLVRRMDEDQQMDAGLLPRLFELGLMGIEIPEEYGGSGGTFFEAALAVETISAVDPAVGLLIDVQNTLLVTALARWGTAEQKQKYLTRLAADTVGAYALSEAGAGSDAFALQTRAEKRGGSYVLNGRKLWISNAKEAGLFIVFATVDASAGYKGITAFLVEKGAPGFTIGRKEDKLGIRASSTCELIFDECAVPAEQLLGEVGKGYKIAIETLNEGRIGIGAQMLGLAEGAWGHAAKFARERRQFGKAIVDFQAMQFQLAEMATGIEAAKLLVYNAARLKDAKLAFRKEAAMCKYFASHVAERVASLAVEVFG